MNIVVNIARLGGAGAIGRPFKQGLSLFVDLRTNPLVALGWWDNVGWDTMNLVPRENKMEIQFTVSSIIVNLPRLSLL